MKEEPKTLKLYMLLLGCRPQGRHIEQHDIFFAIGSSLSALIPAIRAFWPEAKGQIHIDAWREVTTVDGFGISITPAQEQDERPDRASLFFINLGGYREQEFEEYHYKVLAVADSLDVAKLRAKETAFYRHTGIVGGPAHIDDKYGVDADDIHAVRDILPPGTREQYRIALSLSPSLPIDEWHLGYLPLHQIRS